MARSYNIDNGFIANDLVKEVCDARHSENEIRQIVRNLSVKADLIVLENPILQSEIAKACTQISEYYEYDEGRATAKYLRAKSSSINGDNQEAIELLNEALSFFQEINNEPEIARVQYSLANAHKALKQFDLSLKYFFHSLKIFEKLKDKNHVARIYSNIGAAFFSLNNFSEGLIYFHKALACFKELENNHQIAYCLLNIGVIYQYSKQLSIANQYFNEVLELTKEINDPYLNSLVFFNKGVLYEELESFATAKAFYQKSLDEQKKCNFKEGIAQCHFYLGKLLMKAEEYSLAQKSLLMAYFSYNELLDTKEMANCCATIAKSYEKTEDYQTALKFEREHSQLLLKMYNKDLKNASNFQKIGDYSQERDVVKILELNREQILLNQKNKQLREFAGIVSHDLREPLRTIVSFTEHLNRKCGHQIDDAGKEYMNFVVDAGKRMAKMLQDLKTYALLGIDEHEIDHCDLNQVVEMVRRNLYVKLVESETHLIIPNNMPTINSSFTKLVQLFQNLISNGIKFKKTDLVSRIEITCVQTDEHLVLCVKDNGIGIAQEDFDLIFKIFKRLDIQSKVEGSGVGLAICQQIVHQLNGNIYLESEVGEGTSFFIELPKTSIVSFAATA